MVVVDLVTGVSISVITAPRAGAPERITYSPMVAPPQSSITSLKETPRCPRTNEGRATSPVQVRSRLVTGVFSVTASYIFIIVGRS